MSADERLTDTVAGERSLDSLSRIASMRSRVGSVLAVGLMSALGLGSLGWYYAHAYTRDSRMKDLAQAAVTQRAQGDLALPSLGRIDPPASRVSPPVSPPSSDAAVTTSSGSTPPNETWSPLAGMLREIPLEAMSATAQPATASLRPDPTPATERPFAGAVFVPQTAIGGSVVPPLEGVAPVATSVDTGLSSLLHATRTAAVPARLLPARRLLLPKGAFLDCTLETAIDSTLPGMTTCVMATDVFGADGQVVLLERGTKLIGETRGQVQQGAARIFVLWTEARAPTGVVVPLDSPGADELGRSGLPGAVDRHFWQRFGAAMLVSVIDGVAQTAAPSARNGGGTVVLNPSTSQEVLTEILKNTINIPPTVTKRNGDRIQVLVARDVDFRQVYELRSADR